MVGALRSEVERERLSPGHAFGTSEAGLTHLFTPLFASLHGRHGWNWRLLEICRGKFVSHFSVFD